MAGNDNDESAQTTCTAEPSARPNSASNLLQIIIPTTLISLYRKHICENVATMVQEKRPVLQNSSPRVAGLGNYAWQGSCCNDYRLF